MDQRAACVENESAQGGQAHFVMLRSDRRPPLENGAETLVNSENRQSYPKTVFGHLRS